MPVTTKTVCIGLAALLSGCQTTGSVQVPGYSGNESTSTTPSVTVPHHTHKQPRRRYQPSWKRRSMDCREGALDKMMNDVDGGKRMECSW